MTQAPHNLSSEEALLQSFFDPTGNDVWPTRVLADAKPQLRPFLTYMREARNAPIVLPRHIPGEPSAVAYVIVRRDAETAHTRELLTAFVGPSYSNFDGTLARLDEADLVDQAVIAYAGANRTFVLESPIQSEMWHALDQMCRVAAARPANVGRSAPHLSALLAEFEAALAAGENAAAAGLLDQLSVSSVLEAPNLAYLRVKYLARLGRSADLLRLSSLGDVVASQPPFLVREAVLAAIHDQSLADVEFANGIEVARPYLSRHASLLAELRDTEPTRVGASALTVLLVLGLLVGDRNLIAAASTAPAATQVPPSLLALAGSLEPVPVLQPEDAPSSGLAEPAVSSWLALFETVRDNRRPKLVADLLSSEAWTAWPHPAEEDDQIAELLESFGDDEAERGWSVVGAFVDADNYATPATQSARQLLSNALTFGRFTPGDLAMIVVLADIVMRSAPDNKLYAGLLEDLAAEHQRWVGPGRATVALDLVDLLCRSACPDEAARSQFTESVLSLLQAHQIRLSDDQRLLARRLAKELYSATVWDLPAPPGLDDDAPSLDKDCTILLYSLDQAVLARATDVLAEVAPRAKVHQSSHRVGSDQLKQWAKSADLVVMATRCAQHAATGFIRVHAENGLVREADGSGSASLIRAAAQGLAELL